MELMEHATWLWAVAAFFLLLAVFVLGAITALFVLLPSD
jgi:hypothetical protein